MIIENDEAAIRLAKAICADVLLYNGDKARAVPPERRGPAIAEAVQEGRDLFVTRVAPRLFPVYEVAVAEVIAAALGIDASSIVAGVAAPPVELGAMAPLYGGPGHGSARGSARGFDELGDRAHEPRRRTKPSNVPVIAAVLLVVLSAACWYFLRGVQW